MQDRLQKLFTEIKLDETDLKYFDDASIEKVIIYDQNKIVEFLINTKNIIPIDVYNNIQSKLTNFFNNFEIIRLIIIPKEVDYSKLLDYYQYIMKEICLNYVAFNCGCIII